MDNQSEMKLLCNDLDNIFIRIESLEAHPCLTEAGMSVLDAKAAIRRAATELHQADMQMRFAKQGA